MRNLYGTRSIVPNNYSFTFDKIYYEEVPAKQNDGILIGRSVLYHPDKTVYLKTADGYKQIAKLDNTERLIRNEGMVLLPEHNVSSINYLSGDCATYNGDGLYILNYEELKTKTENGGYSQVSDSSVYDANIIYFTKKENETEYIQTICSNNYKTIGKDSIYCNYFGTADDKKYAYPLYALEDNSFQNISQNNLFYKNEGVEDCGFIPDLTGETFIYLREYKLMKESDSGTYYLTNSEAEKHKVLDNNIYYSYEKQENVYKKVTDLVVEKDYYINNNSFSLISSAPEGTEIGTKYEQYIYYLYQTTNNGATSIQGYFIYPTEDKNWGKGQDFPYILINNAKSYTDYRDDGMLYFLSKEDENDLDSWPSIRGIPKEDYLQDSVFLLEQRSNRIIEDETNIVKYENQSDLPNNVPNLYCYTMDNNIIKEKTLISNTAENWHLAKAAGNKSMGVPTKLSVEMYQILTDITMCTNTDGKIIKGKLDKDTDRKELYHNNKTFIRKGKRVYEFSGDGQGAIDEDTSKVFYKYDPADRHGLIEVPKNSNLSDTSIYVIDKKLSSWGEWEDITEQYTGYIGDLDPNTVGFMSPEDEGSQSTYVFAQLPYNKHTQYYTDNQGKNTAAINQMTFDNSCDSNGTSSIYYVKANANRGNLNNSNTLVEATNTIDEIIGSKTRLYGKQVNQITQGSLSKDLADDLRPYNIPEDDIMDTLVHHDADIGAIENLSNEKDTYNLTFTKQNEQPDNINSSNNNTVNVRSLTDSTIKTDNMIGYINRLGIKSTVNGNGHDVKGITGTGNTKEDNIENNQIFSDARPYNIPETNIIDTLVHHDADIGAIEDLKARQGSDNNTNNLNFTTAKDPTDTDQLKGVNDIQSIKDALIILDNLIGARRRLSDTTLATNDTTLINSNADSNDKRPVNIPENNIIDSIIHHDADIGEIEKLNTTHTSERTMNNNNLIYSSSATNQKIRKEDNEWKVAEIRSLTDAIEALDKIIGPIIGFNGKTVSGMVKDLDATIDFPYDLNDTRSINIPDHNIIYAIGHHDADIGAIENLKAGQKEKNNTNNLNFVNSGKSSNLDNENNQISNINSLTEAIVKLDNMIGYLGRLNANNENGDYVNTNSGTQGITGAGNNGDARPYSIPETTVIDTLVHHDADIGAIELLNGNNIEFTQTEKDENNKHEINSLTDAITILDNIIGNYDNIENEKLEEEELEPNLKNYNADLVTAINHLSKSIVGYKSGLNDDKNLINDRDTLVTAINALDNILGKFNIENTNNFNASEEKTFISAIQKLDEVLGNFELIQNSNTPNATTFIDAIKGLDTVLGKFDKVGTNNLNLENITTFIDAIKQLDRIIGNASGLAANENIISAINNIKTTLEELHVNDIMEYIRNLAENVDVLDVTIHNMMNEQSLMEWGTF